MQVGAEHRADHSQYLDPAHDKVPFGSNAVRLRYRSWLTTALILAVMYVGLPKAWRAIEPLHNGPDYRIPYALSEDYWLYSRYAQAVTANPETVPLIGDSVVWGQYVGANETLAHALNARGGSARFANLGVNGTHPIALSGLVAYYGDTLRDRKVMLHFNPLWMSSERRDLTLHKKVGFNHPQLVPQFYPWIPCYDASIADRLSYAIGRELPFLGWTAHLRRVYFQNESLPSWTMKRPYANPVDVITLELPQPENKAPSDPIPWTEKDARPQSFAWVMPKDSLQWSFFKKSVETLRERGNDVFVLVGPFNEHLMTEESRKTFAQLRDEITAWLSENRVAHFVPAVLPSETYADASHPLKSGYAILAQQLFDNEAFEQFLQR